MHKPHPLAAIPFAAVVLATCHPALAQDSCPPQTFTPDPSSTDFGSAVAMTDEHLIIGDRHDGRFCVGDPSCSHGMVYAYEKDAHGRWVLTQLVEPADLGPRFAFGSAVAVDGNWMVATAAGDFAGVGGLGAAYFFTYEDGQWREAQVVQNPRGRASFGAAAVLRDDTALIQNGAKAAVYRHSGESWEFVEIVESPDAASTSGGFGSSMDIDEERVVIGASLESSIVTNGGAAYVFRREADGSLTFEQKLIAPDVLDGPRLGRGVAIEGDTLVLGGRNSDRTHEGQGAVYAYRLVGGQWTLHQEFTNEGSWRRGRFGIALAIEGDTLLVSALEGRTAAGPTGSVYVYRRGPDGQWHEAGELPPPTFDPTLLQYGDALAISGGLVTVGASDTFTDGEKRGAAHVFDLSCVLCPPDLDADGTLTLFDFLTFLNLFDAGDPIADFDGDGELTIFDFLAFQNQFDAGCE